MLGEVKVLCELLWVIDDLSMEVKHDVRNISHCQDEIMTYENYLEVKNIMTEGHR
jgi:hypothetical protein